MKSLRSVNYSRLLNCHQTNQKFYLNLLSLLHYLARKTEKNNRKKEHPRVALEGGRDSSTGRKWIHWNSSLSSWNWCESSSWGIWSPSLQSNISFVFMFLVLCVLGYENVHYMCFMVGARHLWHVYIFMPSRTFRNISHLKFPNRARAYQWSFWMFSYLNMFPKNPIYPNISSGSYLQINTPCISIF